MVILNELNNTKKANAVNRSLVKLPKCRYATATHQVNKWKKYLLSVHNQVKKFIMKLTC